MNITKLSIKRPVTILMCILIILVLGFVSFTKVPIDMLPKMDLPYVIIVTSYSGVGPYEVENLVTKNIESAVSTVGGVKNVYSSSSEGSSMVQIEFNEGVDLDFATIDVREKIDLIKRYLPDDVGTPMIIKMDPAMMPVSVIAVADSGRNKYELTDLVENTIQPRLERIVGVASITLNGKTTQEIKVILDPAKMNGYGITTAQISGLLKSENINQAGGSIEYGDRELTVRVTGELKSADDVSNLPIPLATGGVVHIKDFAEVKLADTDVASYSRMNGKAAITMIVQKQTDANTVAVVNEIKKELKKIDSEFKTTKSTITFDSAKSIEDSIGNVAGNAIQGGLLAVLVLLIFLKKIRSTLIVATTIPISIITTFILIYFSGTTINIISLGGLALGVGMLVDNAIVVLENINRYDSMGYNAYNSALKGTNEVTTAIVSSTLTTIVVFLPIIFVEGIAAQLFRDMALSVTFSLLGSLVMAITLIPLLFSKFFGSSNKDESNISQIDELAHYREMLTEYKETDYVKIKFINNIVKKFDLFMANLYKTYEKILVYSLSHKKKVFGIAVLLLIASLFIIPLVGIELMPASDSGQISVSIELPKDAKLEETNATTQRVEEVVLAIPEIEKVSARTGGSSFISSSGANNTSTVTVTLLPKSKRNTTTKAVAEHIRTSIKNITGAKIRVTETSTSIFGGGGTGSAVSINIKGDNLDILEQISDNVIVQISKIDGVRNAKSSLTSGRPEMRVIVDRDKAIAYGLTGSQVSSSLRMALDGSVATTLKIDGKEIDVTLMYPEDVNATFDQLKYVNIRTSTGAYIPLSSVAKLEESLGPTSVSRVNQQRYVSVTAESFNRDTGSINREVMATINNTKLPNGYSFDTGSGQYTTMIDSFVSLAQALLLAILLVYMIMAAQFESLLYPFVIMFSVPFSAIGAFVLIFLVGAPISMMTFVGFIMLAGIVVNNAIVLVDYINTLRREHNMDVRSAILTAGPIRLRPILMTTLTTVLGLIPMAFFPGEGSEMSAPLAVTVVGGLLSSTVLTLIIVPIIYSIFTDLRDKDKRIERKQKKLEQKLLKKQQKQNSLNNPQNSLNNPQNSLV